MRKIIFLCVFLSLAAFNVHAVVPDDEVIASGVEYVKKGMYDEAIAQFDKAIQTNPDKAEAYNNRGIAYLSRMSAQRAEDKDFKRMASDFNNANLDFTHAIKLDPNLASAYYNRGLTNLAQYERAIIDFTKTIELKPDHARAYYYRAVEYFNLKDYNKSRADVKKAQDLGYRVDPNFLKKLESRK